MLKAIKVAVMMMSAVLVERQAAAMVFTFENVATQAPDYASQLSMEVTEVSAGLVQFTFNNIGAVNGRIGGISFQDLNGVLSGQSLVEGTGVDFKSGGGALLPSSLPFTEIGRFELKKSGAASNGIDPGEWLGVRFLGNFGQTLAGLMSGDISVGLHVISIANFENGGSQKFFNEIPPMPEMRSQAVPDGGSTFLMLALAGVTLGAFRKFAPLAKQ